MILINEELINELAQLTKEARDANRDNEFTAEQAFNMLVLHHVCKVPARDIANTFRSHGQDGTIVLRICYPEHHHDARYTKVRDLFFRLLNSKKTIRVLTVAEGF